SIAAASLAKAAGGGSAALAWKLIGIMTTTNLKITGAALLILAVVSTPILLNHRSRSAKPAEPAVAVEPEATMPAPAAQPATELAAPAPKAADPAVKKSLAEQVTEAPKRSCGEIEAYLQQNKRNVESLLAAFRVSGDKAYLREAATNFPNDPAVQFATIAFDVFPEQRRQWLEAFKGASPNNAVAWYLSA